MLEKYNEPDYELILKEGCNFALENTMIGHNPEVKEKLESLGIPVMVERSSYEERSEERRVGKECRSRWSPYD